MTLSDLQSHLSYAELYVIQYLVGNCAS